MKVLVWGLGYVGTVSAACLAHLGHEVVGVEPSAVKVASLANGVSPVREPGLDALVFEGVRSGRLRGTGSGRSLVRDFDVSLVCVGTPSGHDGVASLEHVRAVVDEVGLGLRGSSRYHTVVLRSTVPPGTTRRTLAPLLEERSLRLVGGDVGLATTPEFMRETTAIADFYDPPYTVIGGWDARSSTTVATLMSGIAAPLHRVTLEEAELLKLACNAFHGLKVGFANEIGRLCGRLDIDSRAVMQLVCLDTKLNVSASYLKPGFAFGGSCLPKDLRALTGYARRLGVLLPILDAVLPSNKLQIEAARATINELGVRKIAILGLGFKPGTDDLRESPMIELIRGLWQDGLDVLVHDPDLDPAVMLGSNREYLERQLPQIGQIFCAHIEDALRGADAVVVGQDRPAFTERLEHVGRGVPVLDLVGLARPPAIDNPASYRGLSWAQPPLTVGSC